MGGGLHGTNTQKRYDDGSVVSLAIYRTDDPAYPSEWNYALHYGVLDPDAYPALPFDGEGTIRRYDNAHEDTKGHELHLLGRRDPLEIEFPGMRSLLERFWSEVPTERVGP